MQYSPASQIKLKDALNAVPTKDGKAFVTLFNYGSLELEIYVPKGRDVQKPHSRDELYIVASGNGWFVCQDQRMAFSCGDALFAAAGEVHRFEDFSDDFAVWVMFYGPEGGEHGV